MDYTEPLFEAEDAPYEDFDLGAGFEGSFIPGGSVEFRMREMVNAILFSGQAPTAADLEQFRKAVQAIIPGSIFSYSGVAPALLVAAAQLVTGVMPVPRMPPGFQARNYLVNGNMNVWQRGPAVTFTPTTAATAALSYTADRWAATISLGPNDYRVKREGYSTEFPNCARLQRVAGSTSTQVVRLVQPLASEDSRPLAGRTVTLCFRARAGANFSGTTIGSRVRAGTGTDQALVAWTAGTATGFVTLDQVDTHAVTVADQVFNRTFTVPANARQLAVEFRWAGSGTAGAADYVDITAVRLQPGLEAYAQRESVVRELRACQRFYNKTFDYEIAPALATNQLGGSIGSSPTNNSQRDCHVRWTFPVEMLKQPSVTLYNPIAFNTGWGAPTTGDSYTSVITGLGTRGIAVSNVPGIPAGRRVAIHAVALAEL
jgi:hypothetical protein